MKFEHLSELIIKVTLIVFMSISLVTLLLIGINTFRKIVPLGKQQQ